MNTINLTIDNKTINVDSNTTIYRAAVQAGIYIPGLCEHPDLPPSGECGLCLVEIGGESEPVLACTAKVTDGIVVKTDSPALRKKQREILFKILSQHPTACLMCWRNERCKPFDICLRTISISERCITCPRNGQCELQKVCDFIDIGNEPVPYTYRNLPALQDNPFFDLDYNLCISCGRCIRACGDLRSIKVLDFKDINGYKVAGPVKDDHTSSGCKYCFSCVEVCPTGALIDKEARYNSINNREGYVVPCRDACPAHIDIPRYIYYIARKQYNKALAVIREKVPFPGSLGRVCIHPCEQACRRDDLNKNEPVCIKFLKRYASDHDNELWKQKTIKLPATGKKVAVVGSGPAGLTTAYYLAKKGHAVTIFEALPQTGGMMRVGIPAYRLPRDILDAEIKVITETGVVIKTNSRIESIDQLTEQGFNAVFVGIGAHKGQKADIKGENSQGVIDGVDFLRKVSLGEKVAIGKEVAVIGGGNAAIDCARTALRIGATKVTMVYRRTRAEMPAAAEEVTEALHEGVNIVFLTAPEEIRLKDNELELVCIKMELGEPDASGRRRPVPVKGSNFSLNFQTIISSIGQTADIPAQYNLELGRGNIKVNSKTMETSRKGVFSGGDIVTGPASVIGAIAQGRLAATNIDKYLGGDGKIEESLIDPEIADPYFGQTDNFTDKHQPVMPCIHDAQRLTAFNEVETGYDETQAIEEAKRCLRCDMRLRISPVLLPPDKVKTI